MPIWGNTGVMGQNGRGKMNRSRPTYYDIDIDLVVLEYIDILQWNVIQYLDRER